MKTQSTHIQKFHQVFLYYSKLQNHPKCSLPATIKPTYDGQQIILEGDDSLALRQAASNLKKQLGYYYLHIVTNKSENLSKKPAVKALEKKMEMDVMSREAFGIQLDRMRAMGMRKLVGFYEGRIKGKENVWVFIVKRSDLHYLENAIDEEEQEEKCEEKQEIIEEFHPVVVPPRSPRKSKAVFIQKVQPAQNSIKFDLGFDGRTLIKCALLKLLQKNTLLQVNLQGIKGSLHAIGPRSNCTNFKRFVQQSIKNKTVFVVQCQEQQLNKKALKLNQQMPSWYGGQIFTDEQLKTCCLYLEQKFNVKTPMEVYRGLKESKGSFIFVTCLEMYEEKVNEMIRRELGVGSSEEGSQQEEEEEEVEEEKPKKKEVVRGRKKQSESSEERPKKKKTKGVKQSDEEVAVKNKKKTKVVEEDSEEQVPKKKKKKKIEQSESQQEVRKPKKKSKVVQSESQEEPKPKKKSKAIKDDSEEQVPKPKKKSKVVESNSQEQTPKPKKTKSKVIESDESQEPKPKKQKSKQVQKQKPKRRGDSSQSAQDIDSEESQGYTKVSKKRKAEKPLTEVASKTIRLVDFDQKNFRGWFQKNQKVDQSNILVKNHNDDVFISLLGRGQKNSNSQAVQAFNMYFQFARAIFIEADQVKLVKQLIQSTKKTNPNYNIQYKQGHCPYSFTQLQKAQCRKNQLRSIQKKNTKAGGRNIYPFHCVTFTGLYNIGLMIQTQIKSLAKKLQLDKKKMRIWQVQLPEIIEKHSHDARVRRIVEERIKQEVEKVLKLEKIEWVGKTVNVSVIPMEETSDTVVEMVRRGLEEAVMERFMVEKVDYDVAIDELYSAFPEIDDQKHIFVNDKTDIVMIGFDIGKQHLKILKLIESSKQQRVLQFGSHVLPIIQHPLQMMKRSKTQNLSIKQTKHGNTIIITFYGLKNVVDRMYGELKIQVEKAEEESDILEMSLDKDEARALREHRIIDDLKEKFAIKTTLREEVFDEFEVVGEKGKVVLTSRTVNEYTGKTAIVVFEQRDLSEINKSQGKPQRCPIYQCCTPSDLPSLLKKQKSYTICIPLPTHIPLQQFLYELVNLFQNPNSPSNTFAICSRNPSEFQIITKFMERASHGDKKIVIGEKNKLQKQEQCMWYWEESGRKTPYPDKAMQMLTEGRVNKLPVVELTQKELDITEPTHVYMKVTGKLKHVRSHAEIDVLPGYSFMINGKTYRLADSEILKIQQSISNQVKIISMIYLIDLQRMIQTNVFTGYQRKVLLQSPLKPPTSSTSPKLLDLSTCTITHHKAFTQILSICTHDDKIKEIVAGVVRDKLEQLRKYRMEMEVDARVISVEEFARCCEQNGVKVARSVVVGREAEVSLWKMRAFEDRDLNAVRNVYELKSLEKKKKQQVKEVEFPAYWVNYKEDIASHEVAKNTPEFINIQNQFKICAIKRLFRIQNKIIWKKYMEQKGSIQYLTGQTCKQLMLFHGTRSANPLLITQDKQQAFNINYSSQKNYFGKGIYFAKQAAYSHNYCHQKQPRTLLEGQCIMLYCRVLVGESQEMNKTDRSNNIVDTKYRDEVNKIKYESIHSFYENSDIYIVYKSRRAYPEYLIQYA